MRSFQITESLDHETWEGAEVIVVKQRGRGGTRALIRFATSVSCALFVVRASHDIAVIAQRIELGHDDVKVTGWRSILGMLKSIISTSDPDVQFTTHGKFLSARGTYDLVVFDEIAPEEIAEVRLHASMIANKVVYMTTSRSEPGDAIEDVAKAVLGDE